jgi:metal-responsive CopG/Arc/MetJ family transcriptional regulator
MASDQHGDGAYCGDETWNRVTLRMPESMIDDLDEAVENTDVANRSELIRQCVEHTELNA